MLSDLCVPVTDLRRTEDAFVDDLFADAPRYGAFLISACYARGVLDLNRDPHELDPGMFADGPPRACAKPTPHVTAGLGCLPRIGASGKPIYARLLTREEGESRLAGIHDVYHGKLSELLADLHRRHERVLLVDCHSMPSAQPGRRKLSDIVLGDRHGSSCDDTVVTLIENYFRSQGLTVSRNAPYAGGYTTRRYGQPKQGFHAIQIEINRGLYMDEQTLVRAGGFQRLRTILDGFAANLVRAF